MFNVDLFGEAVEPDAHGAILSETWGYPPFSVLNAREGWWQERKRQWLALGIKSEEGRSEGLTLGSSPQVTQKGLNFYREKERNLAPGGGVAWLGGRRTFSSEKWRDEGAQADQGTGTSIFDPVVCELAYKWFCPPGGVVLDPFAGGSVRGIVASTLGLSYHGCDLRQVQVDANKEQAHIAAGPPPVWRCGDSLHIGQTFEGLRADFVFSCPPYADLEVYSDDPRDISQMEYGAFLEAYRGIIAASCGLLAEDSFACFVVGEVRDKSGNYRNFVGDTVRAFMDAGLAYYNEAILITSVGSLPVRVGKQFKAGRKLGKTHQNILVFVKGDGKRAASKMGQLDL